MQTRLLRRALTLVTVITVAIPSAARGDGPPSTSPGLPPWMPYASALPQPADSGFQIGMEMCFITLTVVPTTEAHARAFVPPQYTIGRDVGTQGSALGDGHGTAALNETARIAIWDYACDITTVPGKPTQPAHLSLVTVGVTGTDPYGAGTDPNVFTPPTVWSHYVVWAHTDSADLATWLQSVGATAEVVPSFVFSSTTALDTIAVGSPSSPYTVTNNAAVDDVVAGPHDHANEFFFGAGASAVRLEMRWHDARDLDCIVTVQADCVGTVSAPDGSPVAALLGAPRASSRYALRHHKVPIGDITVSPLRP